MNEEKPLTLTFSPTEAEVIIHRLSIIDSAEEIEEIFCDHEDFDPARGAEFAQRVLSSLSASEYTVTLDVPEGIDILAECLEGSTFFGDIDLGIQQRELTRQKASAYRKAAYSAGEKIEAIAGRKINVITG